MVGDRIEIPTKKMRLNSGDIQEGLDVSNPGTYRVVTVPNIDTGNAIRRETVFDVRI